MSFFEIDIPTAIKLCAMADVSMAVLLWLYHYEEGSKRALTFFVSGQIMKAIGMVLISLRGDIPLLLSAQGGNSLLYVGVALEMFAFTLISPSRKRHSMPYWYSCPASSSANLKGGGSRWGCWWAAGGWWG